MLWKKNNCACANICNRYGSKGFWKLANDKKNTETFYYLFCINLQVLTDCFSLTDAV